MFQNRNMIRRKQRAFPKIVTACGNCIAKHCALSFFNWPITKNHACPVGLEPIPKSGNRFSDQDVRSKKWLERRSDLIRSKRALVPES